MDGQIQVIIGLFERLNKLMGWKYNEEQAKFLAKQLPKLQSKTVENISTRLVNEHKFQPALAEILTICKEEGAKDFQPAQTGTASKFMQELEKREREMGYKAKQAAETYMKTSRLAATAKAESWEGELNQFARLTANTMAQMLYNTKQPYGWSNLAVPKELVTEYCNLLRSVADVVKRTGEINIELALPPGAESLWRKAAANRPKEPEDIKIALDEMLARVTEHFKIKKQGFI